mmetsp:Transcript_13869/g.6877  ORF Transcript_13869/g.6877 Transcript_13869/m.6877 type:complete len:116 (+) Transcript_13869:122-469(+)
MRAIGLAPTQKEIADMIEVYDHENTGRIEVAVFLQLVRNKKQDTDTEEELIEAFREFDKDRLGWIWASEFRYILINFGEKMTDEDVDKVMDEAGVDTDGKVKYEDYVKNVLMAKA